MNPSKSLRVRHLQLYVFFSTHIQTIIILNIVICNAHQNTYDLHVMSLTTLCILFNTYPNNYNIENCYMYHTHNIYGVHVMPPTTLCILFNTHLDDYNIENCHMYHTLKYV
jgi:hypothetical protein